MRSIPTDATDLASSPLCVVDAGAWDILFVVSEMVAGAYAGQFTPMLPSTRGQLSQAMRFAKALLSRCRPFRRFIKPQIFIVARHNGSTVGAALATPVGTKNGVEKITLDVVTVDERFRNRGVGHALVRAVTDTASHGTEVHCVCAHSARAMQRLVSHLGFHCQRAPEVVTVVNGVQIMVPALWVKRI